MKNYIIFFCYLICIILSSVYRESIPNKELLVVIIVTGVIIYLASSWIFNKEGIQQCVSLGNHQKNGLQKNSCIDVMHIFHFQLWTLIGILMPDKYLEIITISIIWELYEHFLFKWNNTCSDYYCGRVEDVFINITGYTLGSIIAAL